MQGITFEHGFTRDWTYDAGTTIGATNTFADLAAATQSAYDTSPDDAEGDTKIYLSSSAWGPMGGSQGYISTDPVATLADAFALIGTTGGPSSATRTTIQMIPDPGGGDEDWIDVSVGASITLTNTQIQSVAGSRGRLTTTSGSMQFPGAVVLNIGVDRIVNPDDAEFRNCSIIQSLADSEDNSRVQISGSQNDAIFDHCVVSGRKLFTGTIPSANGSMDVTNCVLRVRSLAPLTDSNVDIVQTYVLSQNYGASFAVEWSFTDCLMITGSNENLYRSGRALIARAINEASTVGTINVTGGSLIGFSELLLFTEPDNWTELILNVDSVFTQDIRVVRNRGAYAAAPGGTIGVGSALEFTILDELTYNLAGSAPSGSTNPALVNQSSGFGANEIPNVQVADTDVIDELLRPQLAGKVIPDTAFRFAFDSPIKDFLPWDETATFDGVVFANETQFLYAPRSFVVTPQPMNPAININLKGDILTSYRGIRRKFSMDFASYASALNAWKSEQLTRDTDVMRMFPRGQDYNLLEDITEGDFDASALTLVPDITDGPEFIPNHWAGWMVKINGEYYYIESHTNSVFTLSNPLESTVSSDVTASILVDHILVKCETKPLSITQPGFTDFTRGGRWREFADRDVQLYEWEGWTIDFVEVGADEVSR
jgi:hypothetical protein